MPIRFQDWILRDDLQSNPIDFYVFGDNLHGVGYGGQAREMRGEPNAIGIVTKVHPSCFIRDKNTEIVLGCMRENEKRFELIRDALRDGKYVTFPTDGVGTGFAKLQEKAPKFNNWLQLQLMEIIGEYPPNW